MTVQEFLKESYDANEFERVAIGRMRRPRVKCKDGFEISIQASFSHYCNPRKTFAGPYDEVELGFPSGDDSLIEDYAENEDEPTDTVYGYVPIDIVEKLIEKHGGIVEDQELVWQAW